MFCLINKSGRTYWRVKKKNREAIIIREGYKINKDDRDIGEVFLKKQRWP